MAIPDIRSTLAEFFEYSYDTGPQLARYAGCVAGAQLAKAFVQARFSGDYHNVAANTWMGPLRSGGMSSHTFIRAAYSASYSEIRIAAQAFHAAELMTDAVASNHYSQGIEAMMRAIWSAGKRHFVERSMDDNRWATFASWVDEAVMVVDEYCLPFIATLKTAYEREKSRPTEVTVSIVGEHAQELYVENRPMPGHNALFCTKCGVCAHCAWDKPDCTHRFADRMRFTLNVRADHDQRATVYEFTLKGSTSRDFKVVYHDHDVVTVHYGNGLPVPPGQLHNHLVEMQQRYDNKGSKVGSKPSFDEVLTQIAVTGGVIPPRWIFEIYRIVTGNVTLGDFIQSMPTRHLAEALSILAKCSAVLVKHEVTAPK